MRVLELEADLPYFSAHEDAAEGVLIVRCLLCRHEDRYNAAVVTSTVVRLDAAEHETRCPSVAREHAKVAEAALHFAQVLLTGQP